MYESPIDIIYGEIQTQIENDVLKAVQRVGVNVDKEELLKALQYDREQYSKGYADGLNANRWIPCSERLPEDGKNCLITYISFLDGVTKCCDGCAYVIENGWFWCLDDSEVKVDVIAWMPLPEPYKGE